MKQTKENKSWEKLTFPQMENMECPNLFIFFSLPRYFLALTEGDLKF